MNKNLKFSEINNKNVFTPEQYAEVAYTNNSGTCSDGSKLINCKDINLKTGDLTETNSQITINTNNKGQTFTCDSGQCCNIPPISDKVTQLVWNNTENKWICEISQHNNQGYKCKDDFTYTHCNLSDDTECLPGKPPPGNFCKSCGKDNNCSGNGECQSTTCLCNSGYFGIHCEKKNCQLVPSGSCSIEHGHIKDNCNKSVSGCEYSAKIGWTPSKDPLEYCQCVPDYSEEGLTTNIYSTECACKLPVNHPLHDISIGIGQKYWHNNKKDGGANSDWNDICRQNYGPTAYSPNKGSYRDCGDECGHRMGGATSVPCVAPAGSVRDTPWAFYKTNSP